MPVRGGSKFRVQSRGACRIRGLLLDIKPKHGNVARHVGQELFDRCAEPCAGCVAVIRTQLDNDSGRPDIRDEVSDAGAPVFDRRSALSRDYGIPAFGPQSGEHRIAGLVRPTTSTRLPVTDVRERRVADEVLAAARLARGLAAESPELVNPSTPRTMTRVPVSTAARPLTCHRRRPGSPAA